MDIRAVIFDMDGTVLNTLEDLRDSLGHALAETGHRHDFSIAETGICFGSGALTAAARALCLEQGWEAEALLRVGTAEDPVPEALRAEAERVLAVFRDWYPAHCEIKTAPYPGVPELLGRLRERGIATAVVSNKLDAAVQSLSARHFPGLLDASFGEREPEVRRKPAPDMVFAALRALDVRAEEAVCVGDSEIDLQTARNAGLDCVAVSWGFRDKAYLQRLGAKRIVDTSEELLGSLLSP